MPKKNFLLFFLYLAVFDFVYNDLKNGGRQTAQLTECGWPRDFSHNEGVYCLSLSIIFDTGAIFD